MSGRPVAWRVTDAFARAVVFVVAMLGLAVLTGRPDMAVLGAPVAFAATIALSRRPRTQPVASLRIEPRVVVEGNEVHARIDVANPDHVDYDVVVIRVAVDRWMRPDLALRPHVAAIRAGETAAVRIDGAAQRWGRQRIGPVHVHAVAADGLLISPLTMAGDEGLRVYPASATFAAQDVMPHASGIVGAHRTRRPGDGGELAGIRQFAPGDRLRRIDWRVSLRTRELHVAATLSERDAEIVVLLDVLQEAGRSNDAASALDTSVRAAGAIARHYLYRGDRVGFLEFGYAARHLRSGAGHRHYLTALEWLLDVRSVRGSAFTLTPARDRIPPRALLIVLTPLVSPASAAMLAGYARSGRSVVAVDTMPPEFMAAIDQSTSRVPAIAPWLRDGPYTSVAARLWRYERANTISGLREHGLPVVPWTGPGSLDDVLRQMSRIAAGPRI